MEDLDEFRLGLADDDRTARLDDARLLASDVSGGRTGELRVIESDIGDDGDLCVEFDFESIRQRALLRPGDVQPAAAQVAAPSKKAQAVDQLRQQAASDGGEKNASAAGGGGGCCSVS